MSDYPETPSPLPLQFGALPPPIPSARPPVRRRAFFATGTQPPTASQAAPLPPHPTAMPHDAQRTAPIAQVDVSRSARHDEHRSWFHGAGQSKPNLPRGEAREYVHFAPTAPMRTVLDVAAVVERSHGTRYRGAWIIAGAFVVGIAAGGLYLWLARDATPVGAASARAESPAAAAVGAPSGERSLPVVATTHDVAAAADPAVVAHAAGNDRGEARRRGARTPVATVDRGSKTAAGSTSSQDPHRALGTLMLGAKPPCKIVIDGKRTGKTTPQRNIRLPTGKHIITLVNREHGIKASFPVTIAAGRSTKAIKDFSARL